MLFHVVFGAALLGTSAANLLPLSSSTPCFTTTVTPTTPPVTVVVEGSTTRTLAPAPTSSSALDWLDWRTFKANGVNLGSWLEKERTHDPVWWVEVGGEEAPDEWTLCQILGDRCGPVLEERYRSFLNTSTIDLLASVGINTLRIPTTYAAWVEVPGSELYTGSQVERLREITDYAINTYGMHIIIGLHSLPGGTNNLDIGEALFHDDWFYNNTNLDYSFTAVDNVLSYIINSEYPQAFTIAPLNEASDNLTTFGSAAGLSQRAANWVNRYHYGVLDRIAKLDRRIPMMIQDNFKGADYWAQYYESTDNIVFDSHVYYFAAAGTYANYLNPAVCGQAQYIAQQDKFPNFIGEWSLQTRFNNTFVNRKTIFDTERYAFNRYESGSAFWTAVSYANGDVDGEGIVSDYWSYTKLINEGVITPMTTEDFC